MGMWYPLSLSEGYTDVPISNSCRCALRSGSRLLSGASMEEHSMLLEHSLLASGEVAEAGEVYVGWPARRLVSEKKRQAATATYASSVTYAHSIEAAV